MLSLKSSFIRGISNSSDSHLQKLQTYFAGKRKKENIFEDSNSLISLKDLICLNALIFFLSLNFSESTIGAGDSSITS